MWKVVVVVVAAGVGLYFHREWNKKSLRVDFQGDAIFFPRDLPDTL